jgi:hypothetical protein
MVADTGDSFYQEAMMNMGEMMSAQFDERVKVVVHADAPSPWEKRCWEVTGAPKCAEKDDTRTKIGTAKKLDWLNDGVLDFVKRVIDNYTSDYYLLVLWGHGEGIDWKQKVLAGHDSAAIQGAGKRFAPGSQGAIEVGELGKALAGLDRHFQGLGEKRNEKVVVGFDACLMGMVEVYYEIQPYVGWAVAANDEIPVTGWPYKDVLNLIGKDPAIQPGKLAENIVNLCSDWYSQNSPETTVSFAACNLLKSHDLMEATKILVAELQKCIHIPPVYRAVSEARDLAEDLVERAYIDLYGFCRELELRTEETQLKDAAHAVVKQIIGVTQHSFSDAKQLKDAAHTILEKVTGLMQHSFSDAKQLKDAAHTILEKVIGGFVTQHSFSDVKQLAHTVLEQVIDEFVTQHSFSDAEQLKDAAHTVLEQVIGGFVTQHSFSDAYPYKFVKDARAISICFPESSNLEGSYPGQQVNWGSYEDLTFSQQTKWPSFLKDFWKGPPPAPGDPREPQTKAAAAGR